MSDTPFDKITDTLFDNIRIRLTHEDWFDVRKAIDAAEEEYLSLKARVAELEAITFKVQP